MAGKSADWRLSPAVCRCCFAEGCYKDISTEYFWMGKREVYAEMLCDTFDVSIAYSQSTGPNSNSRLICEPCISRLRDASDFKRQVVECEKTFMQHLDQGSSSAVDLDGVPLEPVEKEEVKLERVKVEAKLSDDEFDDGPAFQDDDDDDLDDEPLTKLASKVPKKESVDFLDLLDNSKPEKRKSTAKAKAPPAKKPKKKEAPKASASKATTKPEKKKKDEKKCFKLEAEEQNALVVLRHTTAYPFRQGLQYMCCLLCAERYEDPALFRVHMESVHENDYNILSWKSMPTVAMESLIRVDITNLQCKCCSKMFPTLESVASHLNDEHDLKINMIHGLGLVPLKFDTNLFKCVVCSKEFTGLLQLSRHSGRHYSKFICEMCGKSYASQGGLKQHISTHKIPNKMFKCARCKMTFSTSTERKEHLRKNMKCLPCRCSMCDMRFCDAKKKNDHLAEVHGKGKVFHCNECDESFSYRSIMYIHYHKMHSNVYKCQYCDEKLPTQGRFESHIRRYHTFERAFQCTECPEAFFDKGILKRHMVKHDDSKKFACEQCGQLFLRNYRLKEHILKRHT